jgi:hypothetical protein
MSPDITFPGQSKRLLVPRLAVRNQPCHTPMTDDAIIRHLTGAQTPSNWCFKPIVFIFCLGPPILFMFLSLLMNPDEPTWPAQLALGFSSLASLLILGDRPLFNPIQAFVFMFHYWFCWGPVSCALFFSMSDQPDLAQTYLGNHEGALWVVVIGLPLFAVCARLTLRIARETRLGCRFLLPTGVLFSTPTLTAYLGVSAAVFGVLFVFRLFGFNAFETTDYLGSQVTLSPGLAALSSVMRLAQFATVGLLGYLVVPSGIKRGSLRVLIAGVLLLNTGLAIQSGSKGPMVIPVFYLILLFFTYRQRAPWTLILSLFVGYFIFVEPFVASSRRAARSQQLLTPEERSILFRQQLLNFELAAPNWQDINIQSPFRGIYDQTVKVAAMSTLSSGPWNGQSLRDGYSAVVPRFLDSNKAESNMGNFFAHELGVSTADETKNNIAITIPFEFVGNYGFAAGVGSFGLIGVFWTLFVVSLLSEARLATHPLSPLLVTMMLALESSVGQFVNGLKDLPIALAAAWLVWWFMRRREVSERRQTH